MDKAAYIGQRMLYDICDVMIPINSENEQCYSYMIRLMHLMTERNAHLIRLPTRKTNLQDVIEDVIDIYTSIFDAFPDRNSLPVLNCLFTITFYMVIQYKEDIRICSRISCCFAVITTTFNFWDNLCYESVL